MVKPSSWPGRQRGAALLTAVLVVALATVIAVGMMWRTGLDLRRTENLLVQEQARAYALATEEAAGVLMLQVFNDIRQQDPGKVFTRADYASVQIAFEAEGGGTITAVLEEVQGRFSLNNLVSSQTGEAVPWAKRYFERLLMLVIPLMGEDGRTAQSACSRDPQALTESLIDWLDPDDLPELSGAEEAVYTSLDPPYRPANSWLTSTSELLAVNCFTPALYEVLEPYVIALPPLLGGTPQPLNVNTARAMTLAAVSPSGAPPLDEDAPTGAPFTNIDPEFVTSYVDTEQDGYQFLGVEGQWFLLRTAVSIGTTEVTLYSLLEQRENQIVTRLRSFGGF